MPLFCQKVVRIGSFALALSLLGQAGCSRSKSASAAQFVPPAPVTIAVGEQRDVPQQVTAIGHVSAFSMVAVKSQLDGKLERVLFQEGDEVQAGQTLFTLDPRPFDQTRASADALRATIVADQAAVENARLQLAYCTITSSTTADGGMRTIANLIAD